MIKKYSSLRSIFCLLMVLFIMQSCSNTDKKNNYVQLSVCDNWKFRSPTDTNLLHATVPGCIHSDLLNHNLIKDPYYRTNADNVQWVDTIDWIYETTFDVPESLLRKDNCRLGCKNNKPLLEDCNIRRTYTKKGSGQLELLS